MSSPKHSIDVEMLESRDEQGVLSLTPDELTMEKRLVKMPSFSAPREFDFADG